MKAGNIYYGTIMKCTEIIIKEKTSEGNYCKTIERKAKPLIENAVLIKIKENRYIDLTDIENNLDYIKILLSNEHINIALGLVLPASPLYIGPLGAGCLYVDENSLKPYYEIKDENKKIKIKQLKENERVKKTYC